MKASMRDRLQDNINRSMFGVFCFVVLFFDFRANGEFANFGPPVMEGGSRRGGETLFASQVWWG